MRRTITTVAAGFIAAASIAACGSSAGTSADHGSSGKALPVAAAQPVSQGYNDMAALAADIKTQIEQKITDQGIVGSVNTVDCISTGAQTASCNAQYSDGTGETVNVTISKDGTQYMTAGN